MAVASGSRFSGRTHPAPDDALQAAGFWQLSAHVARLTNREDLFFVERLCLSGSRCPR